MSIATENSDEASIAILDLFPRQGQFWEMANLVVEVISPDDPERDLVDKRVDYSFIGIPEYWIIDPRDDSIQVLHLHEGQYRAVVRSAGSETAASAVLPGYVLNVGQLFQQARA